MDNAEELHDARAMLVDALVGVMECRSLGIPFGMIKRYQLKGHEPVRCYTMRGWFDWLERGNGLWGRQVNETFVGDKRVSTVFIGTDENFDIDEDGLHVGPPILFETMIFDGDLSKYDCWRYSTWDEAVAGHAEIVHGLKQKWRQANDD